MNLKERGITIGDLLIISILAISTIFIINKINEGDKQAFIYISPNKIEIGSKY